MLSKELSEYTYELANLICIIEDLQIKLVKSKANLQEYERSLFILVVTEHFDEVDFLVDSEIIMNKLDNSEFLDGIYSTVTEGIITFYDTNSLPLLTYKMLDYDLE